MGARPARTQCITVLVTCPNRKAAEVVGQAVVEERLAACAIIVPGLTSMYRWEGKLCRDRVVLVIMKTRRPRFEALARRVRALHPYAVPEIIALPGRMSRSSSCTRGLRASRASTTGSRTSKPRAAVCRPRPSTTGSSTACATARSPR